MVLDPNTNAEDLLPDGWEHSYERTPYQNLKALVQQLPDETDDETISKLSLRFTAGMGLTVTPRALEGMRRRGEIENGVAD